VPNSIFTRRHLTLFLLTSIIAVTIGAVLLLRCMQTAEPTFNGRSVSSWFAEFCTPSSPSGIVMVSRRPQGRTLLLAGLPAMPSPGNPADSGFIQAGSELPDPAMDALRALGPNAVPFLIRQLPRGTRLDQIYDQLHSRCPQILRQVLPQHRVYQRNRRSDHAAIALAGLGQVAKPAIPYLVSCLGSLDAGGVTVFPPRLHPASDVIYALETIGGYDPAEVIRAVRRLSARGLHTEVTLIVEALLLHIQHPATVPLLTRAMLSDETAASQRAVQLLVELGPDAAVAVPDLIRALGSDDGNVRYMAARILGEIGPAAENAIPWLWHAAQQDERLTVRNGSAQALRQILRSQDDVLSTNSTSP
jgi:hypothetical protein